MIYLDSNIFIYPNLGTDKKSEKCIEVLNKLMNSEIDAGTSVLTWDEVQYVLRKKLGVDKSKEISEIMLQNPRLVWLKATKDIIDKAQDLIERYNLKPRDAIHAATAITNEIKEIISDDSDFDKVQELRRINLN